MTKQEVISRLISLSQKFNRKDIGKKEIRTISGLENQLKKYFKTIPEAVNAAGLTSKNIPINFQKKMHSEKKQNNSKIIESDPIKIKKTVRDNELLGTATEHYVIAELLFRGYNATRLPFDSGIDVFAVKNKKVFYIQVKHLTLRSDNRIKIRANSFLKNSSNDVYYIIVMLEEEKRSVLVLPSFKIKECVGWDFMDTEDESKVINLRIRKEGSMINLVGNNTVAVKDYFDNWQAIN